MIVNTFKGRTCAPYVACDTETRTYIDTNTLKPEERRLIRRSAKPDADGLSLLSERQISRMCAQTKTEKGETVPLYPVSWWRAHAVVKCWAYIVYAPDGFAVAETFDEFAEVLCDIRARYAWWYYSPFDMAVLDSDMLARGYEYRDRVEVGEPRQYSELASDFGARYSVDINLPYIKRKGDRSKRRAWRVTMYDLRNILAGGLDKLLKDFDVTGADGKPIRKLTMDYQRAKGDADDVAYMRNDVAGLWWLVDKASAHCEKVYGLGFRSGKPDVLTASGLAKKVLLDRMYPDTPKRYRARHLRRDMPMTLELDGYVRERGLLGGGRVMVNPDYKGKHLKGITAYRYDINSEYPWYMEQMRCIASVPDTFSGGTFTDIDGAPVAPAGLQAARDFCGEDAAVVYEISELYATVRPDMIPAWRNPFTGNIEAEYIIEQGRNPIMIFKEEFDELSLHWYNVTKVKISKVVAWRTRKIDALSQLIREEYQRKADAKREKDEAKSYFSKLIMNGLGGKFSQNPRRERKERALGEDGVVTRSAVMRRVSRNKYEAVIDVDERALMNVVQGARITCGGRCLLMRLAREICAPHEGGVRKHLFYTDTDSLHVDVEAPAHLVDAYRLGALKRENDAPITEACFLAPKTYYEREAGGKLELHAKGVHKDDLFALLKRGVKIETIYKAGYRVCSLSALNVRGGKALLPLPKVMLRVTENNYINEME